MFFDSWVDLGRTLVVGVFAYIGLVFLLRVSGKRTLTKMNAFDLVVTVAFGSTFATVLLSKGVALAEGLLAFALLAGLQRVVAILSLRSRRFEALVKSEPRLLFREGRMLLGALEAERVTAAEVMAAVRGAGHGDLGTVGAVILETDGSFSVLPKIGHDAAPTFDPPD
ncbi:MAG: DUF421 domain-containing protein [Geminicoccaceae bacterium]|nr:DUF421 domain-containing protein [Geminicoccaceae bacterium]